MSQHQRIESPNEDDLARIESMRRWVSDHYDNSSAYETVAGKLRPIQTILDNHWVNSDETAKLQSLGIAFGDALAQEISELQWVAVDDEYGRDPGLRWLETSVLIFPMTTISKRIERGELVDVYDLFGDFLKSLPEVVREST